MVLEVQASGRRNSLFLNFPIPLRKKPRSGRNFHLWRVFVSEATRFSERRRLCDAKTQLTIPGAQPSSSICK